MDCQLNTSKIQLKLRRNKTEKKNRTKITIYWNQRSTVPPVYRPPRLLQQSVKYKK